METMSGRPGAVSYEFAGFRMDLRQRRLLSADNVPVSLSSRAFETLVMLVEQAGEMLDKSELMRRVWPKTVVEENSLNQCISQLRRALGERPGEHRFIVTEAGRGYRFVAEVREVLAQQATGPDSVVRLPSALPTPLAPPPAPAAAHASASPSIAVRTAIAVLPLANLTRDPEKEYFGDGMAEELINMLTRVPGLKVPARTSSFAYKGRNIDVRQIARELDVDVLLEGSVRSAGDRVRLTVQLVDGQSGYHLWSQNYDRDFSDLFALQDELASAIVQAIRGTLNGAIDAVNQAPPAQDIEAYQLYLRGRALLEKGTQENLRRAAELLRQAVARDPTFARAHSALGLASWVAFFLNYPVPDPLGEAEREAERALALDPNLAEARGVLGVVYASRLEWMKADASSRAAQALAENDAFTLTQHALHVSLAMGHCRQALQEVEAAHRLAPANFLVAARLGTVHMISGSPEAETMKYLELAVDLGYPKTLDPMPIMYGLVALRAQRYAEAASYLVHDTSVKAVAAENAVRLALDALAGRGTNAYAIAALRAVELNADPRTLVYNAVGVICWLYTLLGAPDHAYEYVNRVLDEIARSGPVWAFPGGLWLPELRSFRQDPRFQGLVIGLGLMPYWEKYGPPDNCELRDGRLICH
jgi:TolB-like protein/Flp pilus assembly protein TadD